MNTELKDHESEQLQQYQDLFTVDSIDADQQQDQPKDQPNELTEFNIENSPDLDKEQPFIIGNNENENNCYEIYLESKRRAKITRNLAISSYLETKKIKNLDILHNIEDSESDLDDFSDSETE